MNAPVDLPQAREVCPTTTRRLLGDGALLVDVRELNEVAQLAFDVPGTLLGDSTRLQQALLNYATNAIKFTETGRVVLRVGRIDEDEAGDRVGGGVSWVYVWEFIVDAEGVFAGSVWAAFGGSGVNTF